ncbi:hypothetical protein ABE10_02405, partial [Bacillus toyonensis]|nr:hypothetical protein [Bacillus toyonensis]
PPAIPPGFLRACRGVPLHPARAGAPRDRRAVRGALPLLAGAALRRLRRRGRVLCHLRIPHHLPPCTGAVQHRDGETRAVLGASGATAAACVAAGPAVLRDRGGVAISDADLSAAERGARDHRVHVLCGELVSRRQLRRLSGEHRERHHRPALLVVVLGGAVLRALAADHAAGGMDRGEVVPRRATASGGGRDRGGLGGVVRVLRRLHDHEPGAGVFRHVRADVAVRGGSGDRSRPRTPDTERGRELRARLGRHRRTALRGVPVRRAD